VADLPRQRRRRLSQSIAVVVALIVGIGIVDAAVWTDVNARTQSQHEQAALAAANTRLATLRHEVTVTQSTRAATATKRNSLRASIASTMQQLAATNAALANVNVNAYVQGVGIDTLQTCLGGVKSAFGQITAMNNAGAAKDISAVSGPCTQLAGGSKTGLVFPFDFPDPSVILVGQTYFAYATNSVAGNIQIIDSTDLSHWTAVGNALPSLPAWATPDNTWAPSVAMIGGAFVLYYAANVAGTADECISVATASQPQGPFHDTSTAPLECQKSLGGSIDPASFIDTNGTQYLVWKSGGPGTSRIWSQPLVPSGTAFVPATNPTSLLAPDQPWEAGTVEAPDLVTTGGGHYYLFYSGNDWNSANYAVGVAACAGPLGPCNDASPNPILSAGSGLGGPGGESVFADSGGNFWMAFHAWVPGAVGFPNSRDLYLRRLTFAGTMPAVVTPG
jgi:beta-xylosidase